MITRFLAIAALSVAGLAISIYQSQHFYQVRSGLGSFKSFCNLGSHMNCDAIAASPYAELVFGLPLSSFAAGWFLALFVVALIGRNVFWRREATRALFVMTAFGLVISAIWFFFMAAVLKTWCLMCLIVDGINLVNFTLAASLRPECFKEHGPDRAKWKTFGWVIASSVALCALGLTVLDASKVSSTELREAIDSVMQTKPVAVASGPEFPSLGSPDAPVTIVEFSDFQCPHCRLGATTLNSVLQMNPGKVRVVVRNFPLDPSCNRKVQHTMHIVACQAARVALCAHKAGKFEPVYEALFEKQVELAPGKPEALALEAGLEESALTACLSSDGVRTALTRDIEDAITLDVQSTPTFFINGRKIPGGLPVEGWNRLIQQLIAEKR